MATDKTDLVRFSAYSMKDLIKRKLSENTKFTDQIYEDSNLAVLIDIVAYMYQCLVFQLNNAASESMFADTQIYENIARLCRFIGYNPRGIVPSQMTVTLSGDGISDKTILPMTVMDTGMTDSNGRYICFSTPLWNSKNEADGEKISDSDSYSQLSSGTINSDVTLINGQWKRYSSVLKASGVEYETFVLDGLKSDMQNKGYVAGNYVEVFVMDADGEKGEWWRHDLDDIFITPYSSTTDVGNADNGIKFNNIYSGESKVYSLYLNEDKTFCIKFGNGVTGRKLEEGQTLYVFYLDTNGADGQIDVSEAGTNFQFKHSAALFNLGSDLYSKIFGIDDSEDTEDIYLGISIIPSYSQSSSAVKEEDVEDIRSNAPDWFKTGNRLITKKDYEYFIKNNSSSIINCTLADVKCMNNWDYLATFYKWLYYLGRNPPSYLGMDPDGYRYLGRSRVMQGGYEYVDSADANNLYIWVQPLDNSDDKAVRQGVINILKNRLNQAVINIKTLTSELYPLICVQEMFDISFAPAEYYYNVLTDSENYEDASYLEITMDEESVYVSSQIKQQVMQILHQAFAASKCKIGQRIDYNAILDSIYGINGVVNVRTVFNPEDDSSVQSRACDGISFAVWSDPQSYDGNLVDLGVDLRVSNISEKLEQFQFPVLKNYGDTDYWAGKIKIIKKSLTTVNPIKF